MARKSYILQIMHPLCFGSDKINEELEVYVGFEPKTKTEPQHFFMSTNAGCMPYRSYSLLLSDALEEAEDFCAKLSGLDAARANSRPVR